MRAHLRQVYSLLASPGEFQMVGKGRARCGLQTAGYGVSMLGQPRGAFRVTIREKYRNDREIALPLVRPRRVG